MLNLIGGIIKGAIAIIAGGIIAIGGFFSPHNLVVAPPAQQPQAQAVYTSSSTEETASSAISMVVSTTTAITTTKSEIKKPVISKPNIPLTVQMPVSNPAPSQATATTTATAIPQTTVVQLPSLPPEIKIDPETFVGILCYFNSPLIVSSNGDVYQNQVLLRGSGVIINSKGYILTNKHVVADQNFPDAAGNGTVKYKLDHCDVGQLPQGTHLPTADEIRAINPLVRVPVLGYMAQRIYDSSVLPLSDIETEYADFAILRISGVSKDGPSFGFSSVPSSFPYAKLIPVAGYDIAGQGVVTYGFPGDVTTGQKDAFQTLTMTGSVGNVSKVESGDSYYSNMPMVIYTNLEISHGRSGSPLFWRGYVIGLTTFYTVGNRTESGSVASDAIIKALQSTDYLTQ